MRIDLSLIESWVTEKSRVLDLGCGKGELLSHLTQTKAINGYGLENDPKQIQACLQKGINVVEQSVDGRLVDFADNSFDTVIMTFALQVMRHPEIVLGEMLRVGRECILSFPNFGHYSSRLSLAMGRMPVTNSLPYTWYNTPNIHLCTVADFEKLCQNKGYRILERQMLNKDTLGGLGKRLWPNLFAETAVYKLARSE